MTPLKEIESYIWNIDGKEPGMTYIISGGIHGNEKTGIHVVRRLKEALESGSLRVHKGAIYLLLGNLKAIDMDERYTDSRVDLNRCFTPHLTSIQSQSYEASRARAIMNVLHIEKCAPQSVVGIDIHSTNTPSQPFIVSQKNLSQLHTAIFPYFKTAQALLCDPDLVFAGELVTLDEYYAQAGLGLCYETGHADDLSRADSIYDEIIAVGSFLGIFAHDVHPPVPSNKMPPIYTLRQSIILTDNGFEYASGIGEENFAPFSKGDTLGYHETKPIIAPFSGVFTFPKLKKYWKIGKPLGYLAERTRYTPDIQVL